MGSTLKAERRQNARYKALKAGKIIVAQSSLVADVIIRDMSAGGARIQIPASIGIPQEFSLAVPSEKLIYPSQVRWRTSECMGVKFTGEPHHGALRKWNRTTPTYLTASAKNKASLSPIMCATDMEHCSHLQLFYRLRFEQLSSHPERGRCLVDVLFQNNGEIAACFPFFCLPDFGLNAGPAPGWAQQEVVSVRRTRRFVWLDTAALAPGSITHCCTISLGLNTATGGLLEFEPGNEHPLNDLPCLRLLCVIGAANYSSERKPFTIAASALTAFIKQQTIVRNSNSSHMRHIQSLDLTPAIG